MKKYLAVLTAAFLAAGLLSCSPGPENDSKLFTVTWHLNCPDAPAEITETVREGSVRSVPDSAVREGCSCTGWYCDEECSKLCIFERDTVSEDTDLYAKWIKKECFRFKGSESFSVRIEQPGWDGRLFCSADGESWTEVEKTANTVITAQQSSDCYYLILGGTENHIITGSDESGKWSIEGEAGCFGNIMTLLEFNNPETANMDNSCFKSMFKGCTGLTSAPELPSTELADSCYSSMFKGCTGITSAPELPSTELADSCYSSMFEGCTGLISASKNLPAKQMKEYCYFRMFKDCTNLTRPPKFEKSGYFALKPEPWILSQCCWKEMFKDCSSLMINNTGEGTPFLIVTDKHIISQFGGPDPEPDTDMFEGTGGSWTGAPESENTYYYE